MLATVGSTMLGMQKAEASDIDEMGICLEQPADLLGFNSFETTIYRTAQDRTGKADTPSEAGDIDLCLHGLRKFVRMALSGNPNVIAMLYLPRDMCNMYTPLAGELQELAPAFASKEVGKAFLGYLKAQLMRLQGSRGQKRVNRPQLEEQFGYDVKYATHILRLGIQGSDFMVKGSLTFPLLPTQLELLVATRNGAKTYKEVITYAEDYEARIKDALNNNPLQLPDKPDYARIERWLLTVYKREWFSTEV
jgi:predicted nucleotidyltransferase